MMYDLGLQAGMEKVAATRLMREARKALKQGRGAAGRKMQALDKSLRHLGGRHQGDLLGLSERYGVSPKKIQDAEKLRRIANPRWKRMLQTIDASKPTMVRRREQTMRKALRNPDFSYNRNPSDAAARVRARAEAMGLNK